MGLLWVWWTYNVLVFVIHFLASFRMWLHWVSMEQIDSSVKAEDMLIHLTVWLASSADINNSVNSYFSVTWCMEIHGRWITDGTVSHYVGILQFLLVRTAVCPSFPLPLSFHCLWSWLCFSAATIQLGDAALPFSERLLFAEIDEARLYQED